MREDLIIFGSPSIDEVEQTAVAETLKSCWLGTGPKTTEFESSFAKYRGAQFAKAVSSCTAALQLSLEAVGLKEGDEVITTPLTFCATVNAIIHAGGTPVLADIDKETLNIDPKCILRSITEKTKAIIPVHFAGLPCHMNEICNISEKYGLTIVEDCAHAIETLYEGQPAGTIGHFGCFSFYANKNITTGEGGMVFSKCPQHHEKICAMSLHGMTKDAWKRYRDTGYQHYDVVGPGHKFNFTDMQAAIGIAQLSKIETMWRRRQKIWRTYQRELCDLPIFLPLDTSDPKSRHGYHLFQIVLDPEHSPVSRDDFIDAIGKMNIGVGVHYKSIPSYKFYQKNYGWELDEYPNAKVIGENTVSLPLYPKLTDDQVDYVIESVRSLLEKN